MSLELFNETTSISRKFSRQFWEKALGLAQFYGWKPAGTRLHEWRTVWDGTYLTNDGQIVSAADARSLADALEKSLDDIPDTSIDMDWNFSGLCDDDLPEWLSPEERAMIEDGLEACSHDVMGIHPFEFFAGDEKLHLTRFIRFCKLGSFAIL